MLSDYENKSLLADDIVNKLSNTDCKLFMEFMKKIGKRSLDIIFEYNRRNDGRLFNGKIIFKKKNICWFSVFDSEFNLFFYFTYITKEKIIELDITNKIKKMFTESETNSINIRIKNEKNMNDGFKIIDHIINNIEIKMPI